MARFGVRLENDPNLSPQDYQELACQAEANGFDVVWVPEGGGRDSLTSLATMAMKTESIKLGTGRSEERRVGEECRSRWSPYH